MTTTTREARIRQKLAQLQPTHLKIENKSHEHSDHYVPPAPAPSSAQKLTLKESVYESHFRIEIESPEFNNLAEIEKQRLIMNLLKEEFLMGLHALEIKTKKRSAPST